MNTARFHWKSLLGVSTILFLLVALFNIYAGISVPVNMYRHGAASMGGVVVNTQLDSIASGLDISNLKTTNHQLDDFLVTNMISMCMMMMQFGIAYLAIAWFALRKAETWALVTLALSGFAFIPYWQAIASIYHRYGIATADVWATFGGFFYILIIVTALATILGTLGIKKYHNA